MTAALPPIAVVGRGCVLPGALDPGALWTAVAAGQDQIRDVPQGRWAIAPGRIASTAEHPLDGTYSGAGSYVEGFGPAGLTDLPGGDAAARLDPLFAWVLDSCRQALREAGLSDGPERAERVGVILGNLSFPTEGMARFGASAFLEASEAPGFSGSLARLAGLPSGEARDRFMSGLPAHLAADLLGLRAGAFCLDAACASSLYAIRLAIDRLLSGEADVMLAGAVNRSDSLFLHVGFCALQALSKTGQSRPFHRGADGLVPGEGAGVVALMPLARALDEGRRVLGVIRGVGLSNDGRARNLLAPSSEGQIRAMRAAWQEAALDPATASLIECHATGTPMGDRTEVESLLSVFGSASPGAIGIGSLKSNLGHLITGAGVAGLLKVLGALEHQTLPPTLHVDEPIDAFALPQSSLALLGALRPWDHPADHPRRAAVSAFGFGGNNAHLVVEEWTGDVGLAVAPPASTGPAPARVVGLGLRAGALQSVDDLAEHLARSPEAPPALVDTVRVDARGLRFPPNDLKAAIAQQLLVFEAVRDAVRDLDPALLDSERTGVLVGMQCDADVTSPGVRWRLAEWAAALGRDEAWLGAAREAVLGPVTAQHVLGQMPNIPANRVNVQLDLRGPGFTLSAEELSGVAALRVALDLLERRALDTVIVAAVDVFTDVRDRAALAALRPGKGAPLADGAFALVLRRADEPGGPDLGRIDNVTLSSASPEGPARTGGRSLVVTPLGAAPEGEVRWSQRALGHAHAASGLAAVLSALVGDTGQGGPTTVVVDALQGARGVVEVTPPGARPSAPAKAAPSAAPVLEVAMRRSPAVFPTPAGEVAAVLERAPALPAPPVVNVAPLVAGPATLTAAPALLPVVVVPRPPDAPPAPARATSAARPPVAATVVAPAPATAPDFVDTPSEAALVGGDSPWSALSDARADLAEAHRQFLATAVAAQQRFLALRQGQVGHLAQLAHLAHGGVTDGDLLDRGAPAASPGALPRAAPVALPAPSSSDAAAPPAAPGRPERALLAGRPPQVFDFTTPEGKKRLLELRQEPWIDRRGLEVLASDRISKVLGAPFERQDGFRRQVRMPEPPLLLCDRVITTDATAGVLERDKTIWTESDVTWDKWYTYLGRVTPGVLIESGQADLLLISYMGVDFENQGERVYRLLGCDLTYGAALPEVGSVLHYDIHIDGFATHGDVRIFFFHSDCRLGGPEGEVVLSVRGGQAGFFTDEELAGSGGVLWSPTDVDPASLTGPLDPPRVALAKPRLERSDLEALAAGDAFACFGPGFEDTRWHVRTPAPQGGDMLLVDRVTALEPRGGPWGRGYLRAELDLTGDNWFFDGHFKDDPCMPGTIMFEGCLQCLDLYVLGLGLGIDKDGYRFEPLHDKTFPLRCRGQATPQSREMVYEVFIKEVRDGDEPSVLADILVTVDGLKALHCQDVGVQLVVDFPLSSHPELLGERPKLDGKDAVGGVVPKGEPALPAVWDQRSLLATGWGRPSEAFGPMYERFDRGRRVPRLPGPPYHFMSRVSRVDGPPIGAFQAGNTVTVDYDVPRDSWFFDENGWAVMPFSVLLEVALQPCGWLSSYVGSCVQGDADLSYRNLDGQGVLHRLVGPDEGTLSTTVTMKKISSSGGMIIQEFDLSVASAHGPVFDGSTVFGFFPPEALARQVGVGSSPAEQAALVEPCPAVGSRAWPEPFPVRGQPLPLPGPFLRMVDRVTGYWPDGGKARLGKVRAEKDIDGAAWFFKAHFFQDPVQPGSLGIEAMMQALQWMVRERGLAPSPQSLATPLAVGEQVVWRYRGQVTPRNQTVVVEVELLEAHAHHVVAEAWLWVDGLRIYHAPRLTLGFVEGPPPR